MRIAMLLAAAVVGSGIVAGSANATALMDKPAATVVQTVAARTHACPAGTYWQQTQYYTHDGAVHPAGCYRF